MSDDVRVSWSMLRAHEECKQRSFLIRSGKRAKATNIRSYFHGMVVDRAMMDWLGDPNRSAGDMLARVDELIELVQADAKETGDGIVHWKSTDDRAELKAFCQELVIRLEPILRQRVLPFPFEAAKRFKVPVSVPYLDGSPRTILLTGEMDLLVEDDGWVIWDLKGTKDNTYFRKVLGQLLFYDIANMCLNGAKTRKVGLIQPMCDEQVLQFAVTDEARSAMWARVMRYVEDIWRQNHECRPDTSKCNWCEVKHACARYQPGADSLAFGLREAADHERKA